MNDEELEYDCLNCPSYCCTYPRIEVLPSDVERLARHHGVSDDEALRLFTKDGSDPGERVLQHQKDEIFGSACRFLDLKTRLCTIHEARPQICRDHPGITTCGYYDFLMSERIDQEDPEMNVRAYNVPGEWPELEAGDLK